MRNKSSSPQIDTYHCCFRCSHTVIDSAALNNGQQQPNAKSGNANSVTASYRGLQWKMVRNSGQGYRTIPPFSTISTVLLVDPCLAKGGSVKTG